MPCPSFYAGASLTWVVPPSSSAQEASSLHLHEKIGGWRGRVLFAGNARYVDLVFSQYCPCSLSLDFYHKSDVIYYILSYNSLFLFTIYQGHCSKSGLIGHSRSFSWLHDPPLGSSTLLDSTPQSAAISDAGNLLFTFVFWSSPYELAIYLSGIWGFPL